MLQSSNTELERLKKELSSQRVDRDDLRYDVFNFIFDMLSENVDLRLGHNRLLRTVLELNTVRAIILLSSCYRRNSKSSLLAATASLQSKSEK